jgi:succinate-semialdehyde dehydrogenase/glutarate-semialdehyde dehydrogenase
MRKDQIMDLLDTLKSNGWLREQNAIGGTWQDAETGKRYDVTDPATGKSIGTIPWSGADETKAAILAAHKAFGPWSQKLAGERADALHRMAAIIRENAGPPLGVPTQLFAE